MIDNDFSSPGTMFMLVPAVDSSPRHQIHNLYFFTTTVRHFFSLPFLLLLLLLLLLFLLLLFLLSLPLLFLFLPLFLCLLLLGKSKVYELVSLEGPSKAALARFGVAAMVSIPLLIGQRKDVILGGLECGLWITLGYITQAMALQSISSGKCAACH